MEGYHSDDGEGGRCALCHTLSPKRYYNITKTLPTTRQYCPNMTKWEIKTNSPGDFLCYEVAEDAPEEENGYVWMVHNCKCGGEYDEKDFTITICKSCYQNEY